MQWRQFGAQTPPGRLLRNKKDGRTHARPCHGSKDGKRRVYEGHQEVKGRHNPALFH